MAWRGPTIFNMRGFVAHILKHPELPDYFMSGDGDRSYIEEYEAANVIALPRMSGIDTDFWATVDTDKYPGLKKFPITVDQERGILLSKMQGRFQRSGVPDELNAKLSSEVRKICQQAFELHDKVFAGYKIIRKKAVFRLNTTMAENMHLDTYKEPSDFHFARMFINLDNQPRIWHTSWRASDVIARYADRAQPEWFSGDLNQLWSRISSSVFGESSQDCWDKEPRHIAFFDPGDVWIVDSRQVAHQIFYGRRAVSIDFAVDIDSMTNPDAYYLNIAKQFGIDHAPTPARAI